MDIIIRNGMIFDGRGEAPFEGDIALENGRIVAIGYPGAIRARGKEEIDARGLMVTPGFVDIHTHYDGQAIWESTLAPSSAHGVTTAMLGNCGVGFAPCRAGDRERLIQLMEGVEDIPGVVMADGLTWEWESYPEYLDAVERRTHDIDLASYLPHSALRVFVMRERAAAGEIATADDIAAMAQLAGEAFDAGALGFSTSRTLFHRSSAGQKIPTLDAAEPELHAIAAAMAARGAGLMQVVCDYRSDEDFNAEFARIKRIAGQTGRLLTLSVAQSHAAPEGWRNVLSQIAQANAEGVRATGQVLPRAVGMLFGFELSMHPFSLCRSYRDIQHLPLPERLERLRTPDLRARLLTEPPVGEGAPLTAFTRSFDMMFEIGDPLDYEPPLEHSIAARAARLGVSAEELAYDIMLKREGQVALFQPFANYAHGNLDAVYEMMEDINMVIGLGDGGAHYGVICDASYPTFLLSHWTRDRTRGPRIPLPVAVQALTQKPAAMLGLKDRGVLAPGYKADLNIIDYERLKLHAPRVAFDLPAGGRRLKQRADGFAATIVSGKVTYRDGAPTGVLPGRLVRGAQGA